MIKNKYKAKKAVVDGIVFDSRKEAKRYTELKKLEEMGSIRDLSLQVQFVLVPSFEIVIDGKKRNRKSNPKRRTEKGSRKTWKL